MVDAISNTPTRRLVIAPNASLTRAQAQWFFLAMCGISFSIALFFMTLGLWPVLPFAGLEMAALGAALYASVKANSYREIVSITDERIEIVAGNAKPERQWEFPRLLTQVRLSRSVHRNGRSRLLVTRHGHGCEIGALLTEEERAEVAERLKGWVTARSIES